jgi:hypothetical protein
MQKLRERFTGDVRSILAPVTFCRLQPTNVRPAGLSAESGVWARAVGHVGTAAPCRNGL